MPTPSLRAIGFSFILVLLFAAQSRAQTPITWATLVNVVVTASDIQKTAGCDGCQDAGASSQDQLSTDGYVEFRVGELNTLWMAGLSHGDGDITYPDIDFGFRFNGAGAADVLEGGAYAGGDTTYMPGDVFRISLANGRIQYSKNGQYLKESGRVPQLPLLLDSSLLSVGATIREAVIAVAPPPPPGGGFTEKAGSPALRARFTPSEIQSFLPANGATGKFTFPAPYNTEAVRLTNATTCTQGSDCLWYVGYSYWHNINFHVGSGDMYIFLGTDTNRGGVGPILLRYDKKADTVQNLGPLFDENSPYHWQTGEAWYFSGSQPSKLYAFLVGGTQLRRFDIFTRQFDAVPAIDLDSCPRSVCPAAARYITQPHSSDDDTVHSATVQDSDYQRIGCVISRPSGFLYYDTASGGMVFDECNIDKSGRWLILLMNRTDGTRINRIVDMQSGQQTTIDNANGALGHLDTGYGYAVGADNYNPLPNATILLKFPVQSTARPIGPVVHYNKRWDIAAANHIAHGNAVNATPESQYACGSNASTTADMADEIVCFSLDANRNTDGSLDVLVVGQVMTDLYASGGGSDDYAKRPKGNLDVTGRYFIWTTNLGGNRLDAFLVKIPGGTPVSLDGTTVPSAPQIVDNEGAVWTIGAGQVILRNGVQAASGYGSRILWKNANVYVLGTDANWWQWTGNGWLNVGPTTPGGGSTGGGASPDGTTVPTTATQIVDNAGAVWTIGAGQVILRNGVQAASGYGSQVLWKNANVHVLGTDANWWQWTGNGWLNVGPTAPGGGGTGGAASPDGTTVPATATQIADDAGAAWTIGAGQVILRNGVQAASGYGSQILWQSSRIYVFGTDSNWYQWNGSGWTHLGPAHP